MQITFLGTGSASPTSRRNVSALALRLPQSSETWLFDCGEGTQHQILRSAVRLSQITRIFITHPHGDHIFGLPGLLATASLQARSAALSVHAPEPVTEWIRSSLEVSHTHLPFELLFEPLREGRLRIDGDFRVECRLLAHSSGAFGFRVEEPSGPGRFRVEEARRLGIPAGPVYARLKAGQDIEFNGKTLRGSDLVEPAPPGRVLALCSDTLPCPAAVELARSADLLIHEATYGEERREMASERRHSTARQAAEIAREAGARRLILTHFSSRYQEDESPSIADLVEQARAVFPNTEAAQDLWTTEVAKPEQQA